MQSAPNARLEAEMERVARENSGGRKPATRRELSLLTGISTSTIQVMFEGKAPGCEHVIRFAKAIREDVSHWLEVCGYTDIADDYRNKEYLNPPSGGDELDRLLSDVPLSQRPKVREVLKRTVRSIQPLLEVAA